MTTITIPLKIGNQTINCEQCEAGYFLGTLEITGVLHHVELIEVVEDSQTGEQQVPNKGDFDEWTLNQQRYENIAGFNDNEPFCTIEYDGHEFVCVITPYGK
jgi:hypothetical protein